MTHNEAVHTLAAERYLLEEMSETERDRFEEHYFDCEECADEVRLGSRVRDEVRAGGAVTAAKTIPFVKPETRRARWQPMTAIPWAAAAALALMVGYQNLVTVPGLRGMAAPQAVTPVTLRGATRGALPQVHVVPGQAFVALTADVAADAPGGLAYVLRDASGTTVVSGVAPAPRAGVPFMLLLPAQSLARSGEYVLVIRDGKDTNTTIGEYHFVAGR
jgi:anti-sigma factor RsiW